MFDQKQHINLYVISRCLTPRFARYLLKQAKWSVSGDIKGDKSNDSADQDTQAEDRDKVKTFNKPELEEVKKRETGNQGNGGVDNALQDALRNLRDENEFDLSKRTHILIVSEKSMYVLMIVFSLGSLLTCH